MVAINQESMGDREMKASGIVGLRPRQQLPLRSTASPAVKKVTHILRQRETMFPRRWIAANPTFALCV
jgi:hypothetical protein